MPDAGTPLYRKRPSLIYSCVLTTRYPIATVCSARRTHYLYVGARSAAESCVSDKLHAWQHESETKF